MTKMKNDMGSNMAGSTKHSDSEQSVATKSVSHASFCASRQQDESDDVCTCNLAPEKIRDLFEMVYKWGRVGIVVDENAPAFRTSLKDLVLWATNHINMTPDERHQLFDRLMQVSDLELKDE